MLRGAGPVRTNMQIANARRRGSARVITFMTLKHLRTVLALLLFGVSAVRGQWTATSSRSESSPAGDLIHQHVRLEDMATGKSAAVDLALFPIKSKFLLRVIDNAGGSADLAGAVPAAGCLAAVNGGYFDPNFAPLGLRIVDGKILKPLIHARLMTGILISSPGSTQILRVAEYSRHRNAYSALQCGPLLVDAGRPVKGLDATRTARRTFAVVGNDRAALGICSSVSLAQLAQILAVTYLAEDSKVQRALNLDGGSSSAFWFRRDGDAFSISEVKSVRDFVGIVLKKD